MRYKSLAAVLLTMVGGLPAAAHGPQIQITGDTGTIVTRQIAANTPDYTTLTDPTRVYVMPLLERNGTWFSRPNQTLSFGDPLYYSGPGLAYGIDQVDGGPQVFAEGSTLSFRFTDALTLWNGVSLVDAGDAQLRAFRNMGLSDSSVERDFAITSDIPDLTDLVSINPVLQDYGTAGVFVHSSVRFALLGDGVTTTSVPDDGVYIAALQLVSDQMGLAPSEEFYFVLHKNASPSTINAAVRSLGFDASLVQNTSVPEPSTILLLGGLLTLGAARWLRR